MEWTAPGSNLPCLFLVLLRAAYTTSLINPDHGTLGDIEGAYTGAVWGAGVHNTATPWYTGNRFPLGVLTFEPPMIDTGADTSIIKIIRAPTPLSFTAAANYTGPPSIGGYAVCLTNAAGQAANGIPAGPASWAQTNVVEIHDFQSPVSPTSANQILTITGGDQILSEA